MWLIRLSLHQSGSRISRSGSWISQPGSRVNHRIVELLYGCFSISIVVVYVCVLCWANHYGTFVSKSKF